MRRLPRGEVWGPRLLLRLGESPLDFDSPEQRALQGAVRKHLNLDELAAAERWPWGYCQSKT